MQDNEDRLIQSLQNIHESIYYFPDTIYVPVDRSENVILEKISINLPKIFMKYANGYKLKRLSFDNIDDLIFLIKKFNDNSCILTNYDITNITFNEMILPLFYNQIIRIIIIPIKSRNQYSARSFLLTNLDKNIISGKNDIYTIKFKCTKSIQTTKKYGFIFNENNHIFRIISFISSSSTIKNENGNLVLYNDNNNNCNEYKVYMNDILLIKNVNDHIHHCFQIENNFIEWSPVEKTTQEIKFPIILNELSFVYEVPEKSNSCLYKIGFSSTVTDFFFDEWEKVKIKNTENISLKEYINNCSKAMGKERIPIIKNSHKDKNMRKGKRENTNLIFSNKLYNEYPYTIILDICDKYL